MPKVVDHESRRQELAVAATEVIADKGIENLRLVDVAKQMGVTTGLVTHYLEDKDAVLLAALEYVAGDLLPTGSPDDFLPSREDLIEYLCDILPVDKQRRRQWTVWIAFWSRAANNPALADVHKQYNAAYRSSLASVIDRLGLHPKPTACADAIVTALDGVASHATLEPPYWTAARQRSQLSFLLDSLFDAGIQPKEEQEQ